MEIGKKLNGILDKIDALKKRWDSSLPLSEDEALMLKEDFEITQTYNSNAIEGNTLSLAETKTILLHGVTIEGKPLKDHLEAINHVYAMRYIDKIAFNSDKKLKESEILEIHRLILTDIRPEDAGVYRKVNVRVGGSWRKFPKPDEVKGFMDNFIEEMNLKIDKIHPVILAAQIHQGFVFIHPFIDGNGRTARLLMNLTLLRNGYPPACIYFHERKNYYAALESANFGDTKGFEYVIAEAVKNSMEDYLSFVKIKEKPGIRIEKAVKTLEKDNDMER
ncbi:MAG: Fic family protein [Deltaproteobacteria bacterium]|jgi:Fic family protein|nr:Fic family protein [Deltaproteobacteria bacterium]